MKTDKSAYKRALILTRAREVFLRKGFAKVTMKDIVEHCGISRGGLYLYFDSPKEIFMALFQQENEREFLLIEEAIKKGLSAKQILTDYLDNYKEAILDSAHSLAPATYEFFLENPGESVILQWQFDNMAEMFREIIDHGIRKGEFLPVDAAVWSRHMAHSIFGLNMTIPLLGFRKERLNEEIDLLVKPLFPEEDVQCTIFDLL